MLHVLVLILAALLSQQNFSPTVQAAGEAYQQGDYESAVHLYETLIETGVSDAAVYYNLSSAYYESDQLGYALLNVLRAQRLNPRDAQINELLARIRTERIDFQGDEQHIIDRLAASTVSVFTLNELQWITLLFWNLWFVLLIMLFSRKLRRTLVQAAAVVGVILAVVMLFMLPRLYTESMRPRAVITSSSTQVMSGPGEEYLPLFRLYSAAEFHLLDEQEAWRRFVLPDGRQGWIQASDIELVKQGNS